MAKSKEKVDRFERNKRLASKKVFRDTEQQELQRVTRMGSHWDASGMDWDEDDDTDQPSL